MFFFKLLTSKYETSYGWGKNKSSEDRKSRMSFSTRVMGDRLGLMMLMNLLYDEIALEIS